MNPIQDILTKTHAILENAGQPFSYERNCIEHMLVSPARIRAFQDPDLYLEYIKTLVKESINVSLPDSKESFDHFFRDSISLKNQMLENNTFSEESYLLLIVKLLENLKTPYYDVFSRTVFSLNACFKEDLLFHQTLKDFYSLIIKSSPEKMEIIGKIAEHAPSYADFFSNEALLTGILKHQLSLFAGEKDFWLSELSLLLYGEKSGQKTEASLLLGDYFDQETIFLKKTYFHRETETDGEIHSLPTYLSALELWLADHPLQVSPSRYAFFHKNASGELAGQTIDSPFLNTYAYNMTARRYITDPAVEREQEIQDLELILISPKKSPILVGEAGVGKTSVVEGLSYRLQAGQVPSLLKGKKIFKLTTTSLLSGTKYVGEMEERIRQLMGELEKHPDVILFLDEIHTIVGAGSTESSNNDISNMLKPYIDRGDIKIIGSTTSQEYVRYLLPDKALARRFYPIAVEEPDPEMTLRILTATIPAIEAETQVKNGLSPSETQSCLKKLISLSARENQPADRYARLPELPLTLLEMAFSYAALASKETLGRDDIIKSVRHSNLLKKEIRLQAERHILYQCTTTG